MTDNETHIMHGVAFVLEGSTLSSESVAPSDVKEATDPLKAMSTLAFKIALRGLFANQLLEESTNSEWIYVKDAGWEWLEQNTT